VLAFKKQMEGMSVRPERWTLTQQALDTFLVRLGPDRDKAGQTYEEFRRKLVTFFRVNGCWEAEDLVDTTLDRVIRRLEEVEVHDLPAFIRGVARHVASETHRCKVWQVPIEDAPEIVRKDNSIEIPGEQATVELRLRCLEKCASQLPQPDRTLMLEFYRFDGSQKIENKRRMADSLGLTLGALRVKAFRLRAKLEACITKCMGAV
jgi:DNA-directed RNA polymerase specialized sigma24 family protein